jgi:hypothetical protein
MHKFAKWYGVLLLVLPCMAKAYTVEITSTSRGTMQSDNAFLALLGIAPPTGDSTVPYTLTIDAFVDSVAPGYYEDPLGAVVRADPTRIEVDFTFGGQGFHYAGQGDAYFAAQKYGHTQSVSFFLPQSPSIEVVATHFVDIGGTPLGLSLDNVDGFHNVLDAGLYAKLEQNTPANAVGTGTATVASFSIHAISPVPEPAPADMLAGGLALLMWRAVRHRGRRI